MYTYTLLFQCEQYYAIRPRLTGFILDTGGQITNFQEYVEPCAYFCHVRWESDRVYERKDISFLEEEFKGIVKFKNYEDVRKLVLFTSKNMLVPLEIISKVETNVFPYTKIVGIVGNTDTFKKYADKFNIPFYHTTTENKTTEQYEDEQIRIVQSLKPDFIGLARYMKVVSSRFIDQVGCPIINIHHSFLPSFIGANPYEEAYNRGVKIIGATSHFVTPELDEGPIIEQNTIRVRNGFSINDLKKMGADVEKNTFAQALKKVLEYKVCIGFCKKRTIVFD